jgi:hypothetical protein
MALPVDPKITKLQHLYHDADASYIAALAATYEARGKKHHARQQLFAYIRDLGYCPRCELPLSEGYLIAGTAV